MEMYFHFLRYHRQQCPPVHSLSNTPFRHYKETCDEAEGGGLPEGRDEALRRWYWAHRRNFCWAESLSNCAMCSTTVALITYYFKRKQLRRMENLANHYKILWVTSMNLALAFDLSKRAHPTLRFQVGGICDVSIKSASRMNEPFNEDNLETWRNKFVFCHLTRMKLCITIQPLHLHLFHQRFHFPDIALVALLCALLSGI